MFDFLAYFFVRTLRHFGNILKNLGVFDIMVDFEMFGFIGVPFEFGILNFVFPVVRDVVVLARNFRDQKENHKKNKEICYEFFHVCSPCLICDQVSLLDPGSAQDVGEKLLFHSFGQLVERKRTCLFGVFIALAFFELP